jgi:hypothetical protein
MADLVTGDVIRATAKLTYDGASDIQNVFWFELVTQTLSIEHAAADIGEMLEDIYGEFNAHLADIVTYDSINLFNLTQDVAYGDFDWPTLTAGLASDEAQPPGVAICAWARTGLPKIMSKKWFGAFTEAACTDGLFSSTVRSAVIAGIAEWIISPKTATYGTWKQGVYSSKLLTFVTFVSAALRAYAAYQRRRRPTVGS